MAIAGFTAGQAESLRRAMSRKRSREEMEKLREAFLQGARDQGLVDDEMAAVIYEKIVAFAEFGFPKSHAAAMAETAGKLAWVKRYYPLEFYCAWLNEWPFGFYSPGVIVNEARRNGIESPGRRRQPQPWLNARSRRMRSGSATTTSAASARRSARASTTRHDAGPIARSGTSGGARASSASRSSG